MTARPWLLTPSHPAPHAGGPCSGSMTRAGEQVRGYFVPESGLTMDVGWSTLPGGCGVTASHVKICWPSLQGLLAPASQPLSLVQPHDSFMTFLCVPISLCARSISGVRLPDWPRSFPPHGLRTSRDRGERASAPHQGLSEFHRPWAQVLMSGRRVASDMGPIPQIDPPIWFLANGSHLDTAVDVLDTHAATRDAPIRGFLRAREGAASRLPGRHEDVDLLPGERQEAQILEPPAARRQGGGSRIGPPLLVGAAGIGLTEKEDREGRIDQPHVVDRGVLLLAAITPPLRSWILGAGEAPFGPLVATRGEAGAGAGVAAGRAAVGGEPAVGTTRAATSAAATPRRCANAVKDRVGASPSACSVARSTTRRT